MRIPRLLIAGTASGVGKTTVMVGLVEALRARGLRVATFKCGPDYLDPTYHARTSGTPCHNLDGWMMGREAVTATFARAAAGADIALIEGVMGLYDGASPDSEAGSAAEIAKWLEAPVIAVVDASGIARTLAAVGLGLAQFDRTLRLSGLFANRVGSRSHLELLRRACAGGIPIVGGLPDEPALAFPERHLGLHAAQGIEAAHFSAWGARIAEWCSLDALLALAQEAPTQNSVSPTAKKELPRCRIGVARDAAFHFYYEDNLARLEALGAELVPFSPLSDSNLPAELHALLIGGGYPELHAGDLARNRSLHGELRAFAERGGPIYAECGGLMYIARAIRTLDGSEHPMVGLVPGVAVMQERLQALGYVEVETQTRTLFGGAGLRLRGHQFRYSLLEGAQTGNLAYTVRRRRSGSVEREGYGAGNLLASYVHVHWASNPLCAEGLVRSACAFAERSA